MGRTLLVFHTNTLYPELVECIKDFQIGITGIAEDVFHALKLQSLCKYLRHFQGTLLLLRLDVL